MKVFYEKFDKSNLKKYEDFVKAHKDDLNNEETKEKAKALLDELKELHGNAIDYCTKELRDTITKMNDPEVSDFEKVRLENKDNEVKIYLDKDVVRLIDELWDIEIRNFKHHRLK